MIAAVLVTLLQSACDGTSLLSLDSSTGNCGVTGNCFSSGNFPQDYGTNEFCVVAACDRVTFTITSFETEYHDDCIHDYLEIDGTKYCGNNISSQTRMPLQSGSLEMNDILKFESDDGNEMKGFELCVAPITKPESPPSPHEEDDNDKEDPAKSVGAIVGYVAAALVVGGGTFYYIGSRRRKSPQSDLQSAVGNLIF